MDNAKTKAQPDFLSYAVSPTIDPEFKALIPPLTQEERSRLADNLIDEGCRDALVVWAGENILLDGHNRLEICHSLHIPYRTVEIELPDRTAAYNWIINNQLGRRNLTPEQMSYLRGKRYQGEKKKDGQRGAQKLDQNDPASTAERLADEYKVSPPTIKRDYQFAAAVDTLADVVGEDARAAVLAGDTKITKKEAIEAAKQAETDPQGATEWFLNKQKMAVHYSSDSDEWYTPSQITFRVLGVLGKIDTDPCSNSKTNPSIPAETNYTREDDGLVQDWQGKVYMNPPYGREIVDWIERLCQQYAIGNVTEAIALVPSRTDTEWFRMLREFPRCFIWGRLKFSDNGNSAPFPSMAVYLGPNKDNFIRVFGDIGDVYKYATATL